MPIYEYRCLKCGHQFEKLQSISEHAIKKCEKCGERVTRLFHPVAIHFKGSGFYSTDYGKKKPAKKGNGEKKPAKKGKDKNREKDSGKMPVASKSGNKSS